MRRGTTHFLSIIIPSNRGASSGFTGSDWDVQIKYHAHRAKRIFEIWQDVFGSDERLVKVFGGFHHGGVHGRADAAA